MGCGHILLLELIAVLCLAEAEQLCPPNQTWTKNYQPHCELSCKNPYFRPGCAIRSSPGCKCIKGTYRTDSNDCVPYEQCTKPAPITCPANQEYTEHYMKGCEWTCERPYNLPCAFNSNIKACKCKENYYRSKQLQNMCVPWEVCEYLKKYFPSG